MDDRIFTKLILLMATTLCCQFATAKDLKLTVEDTISCKGNTFHLKTDASGLTNLKWEYNDRRSPLFKTFSTDLVDEMTYEMNDATCFRLTATVDGQEVHSNVECVSLLYPYEFNWHQGNKKLESGHTLLVCDDETNVKFSSHSLDDETDKYFGDEFWVDGVLKSTDSTITIPHMKDIHQLVHVKTSSVCPADTFVFNIRTEVSPRLTMTANVEDGGRICLGDTVKFSIESNYPADYNLSIDKVYWTYDPKKYFFSFEEVFSEDFESTYSNVFVPQEPTRFDPEPYHSGFFYHISPYINGIIGEDYYCNVKSNDLELYVEQPFDPKLMEDTVYLCPDDKVLELDIRKDVSRLDKIALEHYNSVDWLVNDQLVKKDKFAFQLPPFEDSCKITQVIHGRVCPTTQRDYYIKSKPSPEIELDKSSFSICEGEHLELPFTSKNAFDYFVRMNNVEQPFTPVKRDGKLYYSTLPQTNTDIQIVAKNENCTSVSQKVFVDVRKTLSVTVDTNLDEHGSTFCSGDDEKLDIRTTIVAGAPTAYEWKANDKVISNEQHLLETVESTTQYVLEVKNGECPSYKDTFQVAVVPKPEVVVSDVVICEGDTATLQALFASEYTGAWYDSSSEKLLSPENTLTVSPSEDATYTVVVKPSGENAFCYTKEKVHVNVNAAPQILQSQKLNESSYRVLTEGGTGAITFNYGEGDTESDVFTLLPASTYEVTVKDELGCSSVYVLNTDDYDLTIPEYFVANRENWVIENINKFPNARVDIFDRTGKLLVSSMDFAQGWDGRYNGHDMPSADYWYVITLPAVDQQRVGHFTLLRE